MKKQSLAIFSSMALGLLAAVGTVATLVGSTAPNAVEAASGDKVQLSAGTYDNTDKNITWTMDNLITITQNKGYSTNDVSSNYISAPRMYKGHYLSFSCVEGVTINSVAMETVNTYKGYDITYWSSNTFAPDSEKPTTATIGSTVSELASWSDITGLDTQYLVIQNSYAEAADYEQLRINSLTITYTSTVQVVKPTSVTVTLDANTLTSFGATTQATATVLPADATDKSVTWSSNNESVATVDSITGLVTAIDNGVATITATCVADVSVAGSAQVKVEAVQTAIENDLVITPDSFPGNSYAENNGNHDYGNVSFYSNQVMKSNTQGTIQFQKTNGLIRNSFNHFNTIKTISLSIASGSVSVSAVDEEGTKNEVTGTNGVYDFSSLGVTRYEIANSNDGTTYLNYIVVEFADPDMEAARTWAKSFNSTLEPVCESGNGVDATTWGDVSASYEVLTADQKAVLSGEALDVVVTDIQVAVEKYEYIIGKYTNLANFMGRGVSASNNGEPINADVTAAILAGIVAFSAVVSVGLVLAIRRRKRA